VQQSGESGESFEFELKGIMNRIFYLAFVGATACVIASVLIITGRADDESSPMFGVRVPAAYRQWELIAVAHEAGLGAYSEIPCE